MNGLRIVVDWRGNPIWIVEWNVQIDFDDFMDENADVNVTMTLHLWLIEIDMGRIKAKRMLV
jgi:hypothetical protein